MEKPKSCVFIYIYFVFFSESSVRYLYTLLVAIVVVSTSLFFYKVNKIMAEHKTVAHTAAGPKRFCVASPEDRGMPAPAPKLCCQFPVRGTGPWRLWLVPRMVIFWITELVL